MLQVETSHSGQWRREREDRTMRCEDRYLSIYLFDKYLINIEVLITGQLLQRSQSEGRTPV